MRKTISYVACAGGFLGAIASSGRLPAQTAPSTTSTTQTTAPATTQASTDPALSVAKIDPVSIQLADATFIEALDAIRKLAPDAQFDTRRAQPVPEEKRISINATDTPLIMVAGQLARQAGLYVRPVRDADGKGVIEFASPSPILASRRVSVPRVPSGWTLAPMAMTDAMVITVTSVEEISQYTPSRGKDRPALMFSTESLPRGTYQFSFEALADPRSNIRSVQGIELLDVQDDAGKSLLSSPIGKQPGALNSNGLTSTPSATVRLPLEKAGHPVRLRGNVLADVVASPQRIEVRDLLNAKNIAFQIDAFRFEVTSFEPIPAGYRLRLRLYRDGHSDEALKSIRDSVSNTHSGPLIVTNGASILRNSSRSSTTFEDRIEMEFTYVPDPRLLEVEKAAPDTMVLMHYQKSSSVKVPFTIEGVTLP